MRIRFAQFLASRGYLDPEEATSLTAGAASFREAIGAIAMSHAMISMDQLDAILSRLSGEKRFGETAIEMGMLTSDQLDSLLDIQGMQEACEFGEILIVRGLIDRATLLSELARFFASVDGTHTLDLVTSQSVPEAGIK